MIDQYKTLTIKTEEDLKASTCLFCNVSFYHINIVNYLINPNKSYFIIRCNHVNYWFDNYKLQYIQIDFENHEFIYYPIEEKLYHNINRKSYESFENITITDFKNCFSSEEAIKNFLLF